MFGETVNKEDGIDDITLVGRYNVWRSTRWDKFATILLGTSLPTGHFNGSRDSSGALQSPTLQLGKGTATFRGVSLLPTLERFVVTHQRHLRCQSGK